MTRCRRCEAELADEALYCPACGAAVEATADDLLASAASDPTGLLDKLRAATQGEFTIIRELGRGGMGRVYLAHEIALDRRVALKVLPPALAAHEAVVRRFEREARTAAKLSHPNIVPVHQVLEREGFHFFTMPFITGPSLRQVLRKTPQLEFELCRRYLSEAAEGLCHSHSQGLIHRDIKPENMLMAGSRDGRLMLTDFGIAKSLAESRTLTQPGDIVGTPFYMAPEQAEKNAVVDGRSDQYSLGLVGYEMLAGRFPFSADNMAGIVYQHRHEYPEPLSSLRAGIPADLLSVIERAIQKDPKERFPSMTELLEALRPRAKAAPTGREPGDSSAGRGRGRRTALALALIAMSLLISHGRRDFAGTTDPSSVADPGDRASSAGVDSSSGPEGARFDVVAAERVRPVTDTLNLQSPLGSAARPETGARTEGSPRPGAAPGEPEALRRARGDAEAARRRADLARDSAVAAGGDSLFPDRYAGLLARVAAADDDLAAGRIVSAALSYEEAARGFGGLVSEARASGPPVETTEDEPLATPPREPVDSGGIPAAGPTSGEARPSAEEGIVALLETYRLAIEGEDLELLRRDVYQGPIPESDAEFLRTIFDSAEALSVSLAIDELSVTGSGAVARVRQSMRYRLSVTHEERAHDLPLRMYLEGESGRWRLTRLEGR